MKILWLVNFMVPTIANKLGRKATVNEGWITGMSKVMTAFDDINLLICYPQNIEQKVTENYVDHICYIGYPQFKDNTKYIAETKKWFVQILKEYKPDAIHLMGTEFPHCYSMMEACYECKMEDRTVVSIQGLVSIYSTHYLNTIPCKIAKRKTIRDFLKNENLIKAAYKLSLRGEYEKKTLKLTKNVIGRTDWDLACTRLLANNAHYYVNNENLRESFYTGEWDYELCEKHSIFMSQASNPIKGLHLMLQALPQIKKVYKDVKLYVAGLNISGFPFYRRSSYGQYIKELIEINGLRDNVFFTGPLDEVEMKQRYLRSNVFVSASLIENSPNSLGEAMLLGVPSVTSDVGGVKNLLLHGEEGFIYQTDAPYMLAFYVCKMFDMKDEAKRYGINAIEHAIKTHDYKKNANELVDIYWRITHEDSNYVKKNNN